MWDLQYSMECSWIFLTFNMRIFYGVLSIPQNIVIDLNNVYKKYQIMLG